MARTKERRRLTPQTSPNPSPNRGGGPLHSPFPVREGGRGVRFYSRHPDRILRQPNRAIPTAHLEAGLRVELAGVLDEHRGAMLERRRDLRTAVGRDLVRAGQPGAAIYRDRQSQAGRQQQDEQHVCDRDRGNRAKAPLMCMHWRTSHYLTERALRPRRNPARQVHLCPVQREPAPGGRNAVYCDRLCYVNDPFFLHGILRRSAYRNRGR